MLISGSMQSIIRVLLNERESRLSLRETSRRASVSLGIASKVIRQLERTGYASRIGGVKVNNWERLLQAWAYAVSFDETERLEFSAPERPQYLIKKISNAMKKNGLTYAFTLFSATELVAPYVGPSHTHLYVLKSEKSRFEAALKRKNIFPAEKGNVVCLLAKKDCFYGAEDFRGIKAVSLPQLYADLYSYGGRGVEAAGHVLELMKRMKRSDG